MRYLKSLIVPLALVACVLAVPVAGRAELPSDRVMVSFSAPVEVPGMVLPAGKYLFKSIGDNSNILQIWDANETHLYTTLLTASSYRVEPTDKTVATFDERAAGSPLALRTFFAPGETYGEEFIYWHNAAAAATAE